MAVNEFLPFATDSGAAVDSQAAYASPSGYRPGGYPKGILTKEKLNKALRQCSSISSALADVVTTALNEDMLDNGDIPDLSDKIKRAFGFQSQVQRLTGSGIAAFDTAIAQAALAAADDRTTVEFYGNWTINDTLPLKPMLWVDGTNAKITFTNTTKALFAYAPGTSAGFPGRIGIVGFEASGPGAGTTAKFLHIDANTPYLYVGKCYTGNFDTLMLLRNAYNSIVEQCSGYNYKHGIRLQAESHSFLGINNLLDSCSVAAFSVNYGGGAGTGPTHNVTLLGGAYQNSAVGIWAENCLGLHTVNVYHEGNTSNDYRIGVADGGAYGRACYNVTIDGFESSSACAGDVNIRIEHSVSVHIRGAAWNTGCSTTATLGRYDGFSDRVVVEMHRYTTTTPTATAPLDFSADPSRGIYIYGGRIVGGAGNDSIVSIGTLAAKLARFGHTNYGGRDAATVKSSQDIVLQIGSSGTIKFKDLGGADQLVWQLPMPTSPGSAGSNLVWKDNSAGGALKVS